MAGMEFKVSSVLLQSPILSASSSSCSGALSLSSLHEHITYTCTHARRHRCMHAGVHTSTHRKKTEDTRQRVNSGCVCRVAVHVMINLFFPIFSVFHNEFILRKTQSVIFLYKYACFRVSKIQRFWCGATEPLTTGLLKNLLKNQTGEPEPLLLGTA